MVRRPSLSDAGRNLAQALLAYKGRRDVVVIGLTDRSLRIAEAVAGALNLTYDIFLVRKISVPGHEDVIAGAVARGAYLPSSKALGVAGISLVSFVNAAKLAEEEITQLEATYRDGRRASTLAGTTILLVDEGTSSVEDLLTAVTALRRHGIADIVIVSPLLAT